MDGYLIVRLSSLGDIIHALPAFAALRRHRPLARIAWVVEPGGRHLLEMARGLDEIIVLGSAGWLRRLRAEERVALDFQGLLKSALIARLARARERIGFDRSNLREPLAGIFYTGRIGPVSEEDHVIRKNLKLLRAIGIDDETIEFPLALPEELVAKTRAKIEGAGVPSGTAPVVLNTGAAWSSKRWSPEKWIGVARRLEARGLPLLLLWGSAAEKDIAAEVGRMTGTPLAPFLSVPEVVALVRMSSLLVSGDTFALQAACALSVPVVGIFGPTNPSRNGPFRPEDRVAFKRLECSLCYKRECPDLRCLDALASEDVATLALERLGLHA
ncbi:MAG: glycosyltransferase family 9 protein [Candidatus Aminicenantes bacterium]|nr:glycosyltransferase family 9 protein [Candidatus Aminicenantes bacterium]